MAAAKALRESVSAISWRRGEVTGICRRLARIAAARRNIRQLHHLRRQSSSISFNREENEGEKLSAA